MTGLPGSQFDLHDRSGCGRLSWDKDVLGDVLEDYGIDHNGIAQGFLFPASPAFSQDGRTLYVSNLTLYLPYAGALTAIDSDWTLQVKGYTVSAIPVFLPAVQDGGH